MFLHSSIYLIRLTENHQVLVTVFSDAYYYHPTNYIIISLALNCFFFYRTFEAYWKVLDSGRYLKLVLYKLNKFCGEFDNINMILHKYVYFKVTIFKYLHDEDLVEY